MLDLTKAIAAAVEQSPMSNGPVSTVPGRVLGADGDGLCYYCAGQDDTPQWEARKRLVDKVQSAARACGAERAIVLATDRGSNKGERYAVARRKPYQGQRKGARRPANWEYLRTLLDEDALPGIPVEFTWRAEADDLFGKHAAMNPEFVTYTQDKDMNMVQGWHLDWKTHILIKVDKWSMPKGDDQVWGRHWFWLQLLQGDSADNIPGLPAYVEAGKQKLIGPASAFKKLQGAGSDLGALLVCQDLYKSFYGDRWLVEMLEQAVLLWMRNDAESRWDNVLAPGNPLEALKTHELFLSGYRELNDRIKDAKKYAEIEDDGGIDDEGELAGIAGDAVRSVSTSVSADISSSGPLPLDWGGEGILAQGLQRLVGEGGEQLQEVRSPKPVSIPSWGSKLLAKA